jgi:GntR family transcriptional regulator
MFHVDLASRKSIYEQIVENIRDLIHSGALNAADKLPSVRELSKTLTVNPNTTQKAYRELEREGYIYSVAGMGTFVESPEKRRPSAAMRAEAMETVRRGVKELRYSGMGAHEIRAFVNSLTEPAGGGEADGGRE